MFLFLGTKWKTMFKDRKTLPVYDFSCSHIENFFAYFQDLFQNRDVDISSIKTLLKSRVTNKIQIYVHEDLVGSLEVMMDKGGSMSLPGISVYVTSSNQIEHFKQLVDTNRLDKGRVFLLVVEGDRDTRDFLNIPEGIRFVRTTLEAFTDDLNDLLERSVCDISNLMVMILQWFQTASCTETEETGIY